MSELEKLAAQVAHKLIARRELLAVSESSSGGLISAALLAVPGASAFYIGGAVVYTARARDGQVRVAGGERYVLGGVPMLVHAIPGHTVDSLGFELEEDGVVFTGDTLLGRGSTAVGMGLMGEMLTTLARLEALAAAGSGRGFPGHGEILEDLGTAAASRLASRRRRIADVEGRARAGASVDEITDELYAHVAEPSLRMAARHTVVSILKYLDAAAQDGSVATHQR